MDGHMRLETESAYSPELSGGGDAVKLTIGGQPISLDPVLGPLTDAVSDALGVIVKVKLNEQIRDGSTLIQRGAHIQLLPALGAAGGVVERVHEHQ